MNREVHVRVCERLRGKFPRSTRLLCFEMDCYTKQKKSRAVQHPALKSDSNLMRY
jgi:hypothetical protein